MRVHLQAVNQGRKEEERRKKRGRKEEEVVVEEEGGRKIRRSHARAMHLNHIYEPERRGGGGRQRERERGFDHV